MNMPTSENSRTNPQPPEEGPYADSQKAELDATALHLKAVFGQGHKTKATENPEAGCVPWYHFPVGPKKP
jgi:hypothetical protein